MKNVANTGVLHWGGKLLAFWESGLPYELDPRTLDTIGPTDLGGAINTKALAAHYKVLSPRAGESGKRWCTFAMDNGFTGVGVTFYEFAEGGGLLHRSAFSLQGLTMSLVHDLVVTDNYYALVLGPVQFDATKFVTEYMLSRVSIAECLVYDPPSLGGARIFLFPRPGAEPAVRRAAAAAGGYRVIEAPPCFVFHNVNAFEEGGRLVLDTVSWDEVRGTSFIQG